MKGTHLKSFPPDHPIYSIGAVVGGVSTRRSKQSTSHNGGLNGESYLENSSKGRSDILGQLLNIVEERKTQSDSE